MYFRFLKRSFNSKQRPSKEEEAVVSDSGLARRSWSFTAEGSG